MVTVYERGETIGVGMPYDPAQNHPALLANISGLEVPPLGPPFHDWANALPPARKAAFETPWPLTGRSFPPRVLLGAYFSEGLKRMAGVAAQRGVHVTLRPGTRVVDVGWSPQGVAVTSANGTGRASAALYDHAVLATGHAWPVSDEAGHGRYASPWPTAALRVPQRARVAVLGSSLSAIDAAVALALRCGRFEPAREGLAYRLESGRSLKMTFFSRRGLLPEADFFHILPYLPLSVCTRAAVSQAIAQGPCGLLDRVFDLIRRELDRADPFYALLIGLRDLGADDFTDACFASRAASDPFRHARANLDESRVNAARRRTVAWRYALLRMHERIALAVPHLDPADRVRFDRGLGRLFMDNYAAVPPASIERLLALHQGGVLEVRRIGPDDRFEPCGQGVALRQRKVRRHFTTLIDARGQKSLTTADLPFPTLRAQLGGGRQPVPAGPTMVLPRPPGMSGQIHCAALPYLMHRNPFIQGIVESARLAETVAGNINPERWQEAG